MPSCVAYATVTTWLLAGFRVTGNTASPPSATAGASAMLNPGNPSSVMVPTPVSWTTFVPEGLLSTTVKVSTGSATASRSVGTRMVFDVSPGANRRVPDVAE